MMKQMLTRTLLTVLLVIGVACGGSSDPDIAPQPPEDPDAPQPTPSPEDPDACTAQEEYDSTWEGIYDKVILGYNCIGCHGENALGGLDLREDVAWQNIHEQPAVGFALDLIEPGDNDESYLWLKVAAKTYPDTVEIAGAPMPTSPATLSEDDIELLRLWIKAGAPETGTVADTEDLLDACLPDEEPIVISPLDPPDPTEGIQLVMPEWPLPSATEREVCFAAYYDLTDQVPAEYHSEDGESFFIDSYKLRQDAHSHHLIIMKYSGPQDVDHPSFGAWTCLGGSDHGEGCDAKDPDGCTGGKCISRIVDTPGCVGFGPSGGPSPLGARQVLVAQQSVETRHLPDGSYDTVPLEGIFYWNSHAFNLTGEDHVMHGRVNWTFANNRVHLVREIFDADMILSPVVPAFEKATFCNTWEAPKRTRLFNLISHTHKRGERFWVELPDGTQIYENFVYNDPLNLYFDPVLVFEQEARAERTLRYCATYNNGVDANGDPDPSVVKRFSEIPQNAIFGGSCTPTHCWSGKVGEPCGGQDDHSACDSTPGAGDGLCDACTVRGGVSTEDEMFLLLGSYWVPSETP